MRAVGLTVRALTLGVNGSGRQDKHWHQNGCRPCVCTIRNLLFVLRGLMPSIRYRQHMEHNFIIELQESDRLTPDHIPFYNVNHYRLKEYLYISVTFE